MNNRIRNIALAFVLAAGIIVPVWMWMRPSAPERSPVSMLSGTTPVRGSVTVAVDRSLLPVAEIQARVFTEHYPGAAVRFSSETSLPPVMQLLRRHVGAAIIEGSPSRQEDSVLVSLKRPVRRQPIARNALVLIVNRDNPVRSISKDGLKGIFSGKVSDWKELGGRPGKIVACLDGTDLRARMVLSAMLFDRSGQLSATAVADEQALFSRVRNDRQAVAIVTLPAYAQALRTGGDSQSIKAVPVSETPGSDPVTASPATVYSGQYPLSTIVYYLYDPFDPPATGFGAWLAREGQKLFERGDMAPYEQPVRTIILK
ncbi:MAG: phosphate-binding protein [Chlorobiaceae bacterium]|nr:phosphate-binding protein [Chlorobiaceae bacterium]